MQSKAIYFAFIERKKRKNGSEILLEQRPHDASLMAGMWELPHLEPAQADPNRLLLSLRHSITTTNYQVSILRFAPEEQASLPEHQSRKWIKADELQHLPLTGLARKALKRLHLLSGNTSTIPPAKAPTAARGLLFPNNSVAE